MKQVMFTIGLLAISSPAFAFFPHGHDTWRPHDHFEYSHPFPVQYSRWHNGYWNHGFHDHRLGWWWVSGGGWHFYVAPTYPYPEPPSTYIVQVPTPVPTPVPMPPPPPPPAPTVIPHLPTATDRTLFYCASANAYFPYVTNCAEPWDLQQGQPAH